MFNQDITNVINEAADAYGRTSTESLLALLIVEIRKMNTQAGPTATATTTVLTNVPQPVMWEKGLLGLNFSAQWKISVIKDIRVVYGLGLKDAKDVSEGKSHPTTRGEVDQLNELFKQAKGGSSAQFIPCDITSV